MTTEEKVNAVAKEKNFNVLDIKKVSENPLDDYLRIVLVETNYDEFATYVFNATLGVNESGGFVSGHYFKKFDNADKDFIERY